MRTRTGVLAILAVFSVACAPPPDPGPPAVRGEVALLYAEHGEPGGFFLPWLDFNKKLSDFFRWQFSKNAYDKSVEPQLRVVENDGASLSGRAGSAEITWVGHATFAVHDEDDVFLTDPHFGKRALIVNREVPPGIPIQAVPKDAFAVLSHNHYDHLDAFTVENLPQGVAWYVPLGMAEWFKDHGVEQVVELDWWQSAKRGRWTITCLPSQHWTRRIGQGINEALWCSWLVDSGLRRYYFAGDTGYFHGFSEFAKRFGPIDVAMLPIGAYEPRWFMQEQHMNPAEAYRAFQDLQARWLLPMHWGTFDLTDEPLDLPPKELASAVAEQGGDWDRVHVFAVGERWHLPE